MSASPDEALDKLIHDVISKCSSLRNAADMLRGVSRQDADELVSLMSQQAGKLADSISNFARKRGR